MSSVVRSGNFPDHSQPPHHVDKPPSPLNRTLPFPPTHETMGVVYDNSAFYYFMGTMLQFYLLPATWYNIKQFYLFLEARANVGKDLGKGRTAAERRKFERIREERKKCNNLFTSCFTVQFIILLLLWALFVFIMALAGADSEIMQFDPHKILGVEPGAEIKQIKRAYRKQSLIWHPDKNPGNSAAEEKFMTIAKAYEALTDPEARENWEKYGNPDGKQSMEVSLGLPSFLMESENHTMIMIVYLLVLVIVIPVCVWKYYSWSRAYMDAVLTETYSVFGDLKLYNQNTSMKHVPEILCMAAEYKDLSDYLKDKKTAIALSDLEKQLKAKGLLPKPMFRVFEGKKIENFFNHFIGNKLAFILMYAHLHRVTVDETLAKASKKVLKKVPLLIESLANIGEERTKACGANPRFVAEAGQWLMTVHNVLMFSQCMTQAIWYPPLNSSSRNNLSGSSSLQSSLLQLPHFTSREIGENKRGKQIKRREDEMRVYLRGDALERDGESFKRGQKNFSDQEKSDVKAVEVLLPDLNLSVHYGVDGEDQVVAEDLITVDFRLKRHQVDNIKGKWWCLVGVVFGWCGVWLVCWFVCCCCKETHSPFISFCRW
jgi:translocation protein SEC63